MIEFRKLPDDHPDLMRSPLLRGALLTLQYAHGNGGAKLGHGSGGIIPLRAE
jgi:hypothetical protein